MMFVVVLKRDGEIVRRSRGVRLRHEGRAFSTLMIWLAFFMGLFIVYALISWLVKLMAGAGFSLGSALNFALLINIGGIVGGIFSGWLSDRVNIRTVLVGMYLLATISIALLGFKVPVWAVSVLVSVAGAATIGTQTLMYSFVGQFYPPAVSATGLGCASSVGRGGGILAPIVIGTLMGFGWPELFNFFAIAVPAAIAALAILLTGEARSALAAENVA
jgi:AAHS family benzoate transporter-like MFS transporter